MLSMMKNADFVEVLYHLSKGPIKFKIADKEIEKLEISQVFLEKYIPFKERFSFRFLKVKET